MRIDIMLLLDAVKKLVSSEQENAMQYNERPQNANASAGRARNATE